MLELTTEAIVLKKEDLGEHDSRVFLYTKDLGRIAAKATSSRKITSKLASHLEPLGHVNVRLVSKKDVFDSRGFQLVDALIIENYGSRSEGGDSLRQLLKVGDLLAVSAPEGIPDLELWDFLNKVLAESLGLSVKEMLKFLGFDSQFSSCEFCLKTSPEYFYPIGNLFVCRHCSHSRSSKENFILI